jgi:tetratricopeptide (TPR) repeat protein
MRKLIALGILLLVAAPAAAQDPVALVIRLQGDVAVRQGGADPAPASVGQQMFVGDQVIPADGARAILITRAGSQQVVTEETTLEEPRAGGNPDIFARALSTLAQAAQTDASTGGRQGMIRPIPGQSSLLSPRNGLLIEATRPVFRWTPTPGQSYDLMLRKLDGSRPEIFEIGTDTVFELPDGMELEQGASYAWTVFVGGRMGGRPIQPQQEFRIMDLEEAVELEVYLDEISVFGLDPMGDGLFLTVVAYRDLGLFYDAREALEAVERDGSLSADLYLLKGEILIELGHEEAAREAFDKADELMR